MTTVGEALVAALRAEGVNVVFGIPGVHTIELYRGLPGSGIRHVTARHEQGAGFMADGYARVSGKPGVAFVITGPGITNILTAMAQARADSVPMLVVSGVNTRVSLGRGLGFLHELPDQRGTVASVALSSERVETADDLGPVLARAFARLRGGRGGPVHVEVPLDVMGLPGGVPKAFPGGPAPMLPQADLDRAASLLAGAVRPVIIAGGGARRAGAALAALAERLDAPVIQTINARGLMHRHPLTVAASPSLAAVRALIADADLVLAVGTEIGQTDYDMNATGDMPDLAAMVRIDIDPAQLARHPAAVTVCADAGDALAVLADRLAPRRATGAVRAAQTRDAARAELGPAMQAQLAVVEAVRDALPGAIIVGDSTQPVYAANLCYDHDRAGGWFNAATGYGALGYAPGAAVGAAIADPGAQVVCLIGDGGLMFSPGELMTAMDEALNITFVVWNNHGFREIAQAMAAAGSAVTGCDPRPPAMAPLAQSCGMPFHRCAATAADVTAALAQHRRVPGPRMIEITVA